MDSVWRKKKVREALERARELEKHRPMSRTQVVGIYKEGISFGEKIKNLLAPSWFVKDVDPLGETIARKEKFCAAEKKVKKKSLPEIHKKSAVLRMHRRKKK